MKKLILLGAVFTIFTVAASAQVTSDRERAHQGFTSGQVAYNDRGSSNQDEFRIGGERRHGFSGGYIGHRERRRMMRMRRHERREGFRFHHNHRRRW